MRALAPLLMMQLLIQLAGPAVARPRPHLTAAAVALLQTADAFLAPDENLLVPLSPAARPVPLLEPAPQHLELISAGASSFLLIDEDLFRLDGARLARVGGAVGAQPAVTPDGTLIAAVDDKRTLKLTRGETAARIAYHREGRWELERPYVTPDGAWVLVTVRDYTQPLDAFDFLLVAPKSGALEEIHLSKRFVPGALRQALSNAEVALQMFTERSDDDGAVHLDEADPVVFDFRTHKLAAAPPSLRPGLSSPSGRFSLLGGAVAVSDDKRCSADQSRLYEQGKKQPATFLQPGSVVTLVDFLSDESGVVASVLSLKSCKSRGVVIPLTGEAKPSEWKAFASASRAGRIIRR